MRLFARRILVALSVLGAFAVLPGAAGAFTAPLPISGNNEAVRGPAVAQDSSSSQLVAWVRSSDRHVVMVRMTRGAEFGPYLDLSGEPSKSDAATTVVAVADPTGAVTFSWMRASDQHVVAVRVPQGQAPGAVTDISQVSVAATSQSNIAADGLGNVHFVWRNGSDSHVTTRALSSGGALGAVTDVSAIDAEAALWGTAPSVAADALGNRYFTFHRNTDCHIMLRQLSAGGVLGPAVDVSQTPDKAVGDTSPSVAAAGGNVLVVWHRDGDQYDHADDTVYFSFVSGGTAVGVPTPLSDVGDVSMMGIGAAGGPDGVFGVTWQGRTSGEVWYRSVTAGGAPGAAPQKISTPGSSRPDAAPAIGIGPSAATAIAWTSASDNAVRISLTDGTHFPAPPPTKSVVSVRRKSVLLRGGTVSFKLTCVTASGPKCTGSARMRDRSRKHSWGSARFSAATGQAVKVKIKLNRAARKKARANGVLKGYLSVNVDGGASPGLSVKLRAG